MLLLALPLPMLLALLLLLHEKLLLLVRPERLLHCFVLAVVLKLVVVMLIEDRGELFGVVWVVLVVEVEKIVNVTKVLIGRRWSSVEVRLVIGCATVLHDRVPDGVVLWSSLKVPDKC